MAFLMKSDETIQTLPPGTPVADGDPLYVDNFTGDSTTLLGRQTETGPGLAQATWLGDNQVMATSGGKLVRGSNMVTGVNLLPNTARSFEFEVKVLQMPTGAGMYFDLMRQAITGSPNEYRIEMNPSRTSLVKRVGGSQISLSGALPFISGQTIKVRIRLNSAGTANQLDVLIDGMLAATVEDNSIMTAGYCGFTVLPATTGFSFDYVKINTFG